MEAPTQKTSHPPLRLLVEGWRFIPHSYAVVNQFQCLELLRRPGVSLFHRDMPFYLPTWERDGGLWTSERNAAISGIPTLGPGEKPDTVLRLDFPHRIDALEGVRTLVFMTAEYRCMLRVTIAGGWPLARTRDTGIVIVTPSNWSRQGLISSGADPARVFVVPHGIDASLFHPATPEKRDALRSELKLEGFCFLNLSAMTGNKNIALLLKAFAVVAARHSHATLILKGADALYFSKKWAEGSLKGLTNDEAKIVLPRLKYYGQTFSFQRISEIYQSADAYVSPYQAEAFNLPVLEAAACGVPVICTSGGPTDDFTTTDFALRVETTLHEVKIDDQPGWVLQPSLDSLVAQMTYAIENPGFANRARLAGPRFVANGFLWSQVVDRLLSVARGT